MYVPLVHMSGVHSHVYIHVRVHHKVSVCLCASHEVALQPAYSPESS